jgi:invasion protein IalB
MGIGMRMRHFAIALVYAVSGLGLAASGPVLFANNALAAPAKSKQERAAPPAPQPPLAQAAPAGPVRTETITYDAWTVSCRDTPEAKGKKVCSAILAMVAQQQNQRINIGAWIIARNMDGALVSVVQTPQIDIGVLIGKGVELTIGNGKPHQINFHDCNPQRCEALMTMDEVTVREALAASNGSAVVKFWKTDGAEFTININSIKGIDKALAAVRS